MCVCGGVSSVEIIDIFIFNNAVYLSDDGKRRKMKKENQSRHQPDAALNDVLAHVPQNWNSPRVFNGKTQKTELEMFRLLLDLFIYLIFCLFESITDVDRLSFV